MFFYVLNVFSLISPTQNQIKNCVKYNAFNVFVCLVALKEFPRLERKRKKTKSTGRDGEVEDDTADPSRVTSRAWGTAEPDIGDAHTG